MKDRTKQLNIIDNQILLLLDSGHGGMVNGVYVTAPNKMYKHADGMVIYEGVFNRQIVGKLMKRLLDARINFFDITPGQEDMPLRERVQRADMWYQRNKDCIYLSIHGNAGGGTGIEIYTSIGQTRSDKIADVFAKQFIKEFPKWTFRKDLTDGDLDKEENFYVLRKTDCPAILVELGFMDNYKDCKLMLSESGQVRMVDALFDSIKQIEYYGY